MNLLAFDTSTDRMSIALQRGVGSSAQLWQH
ncbi:MAG: tRNA (adenosine(37)-N6)-threonylcarbamoyltransferase complex dimerization subunit type 1 TsaB, partial [Comamonadaceae bacterium CG_4_10_14_0_8_um_filter_57_29]